MHGNTISSPSNPSVKTRAFGDIVTELAASLRIHQQEGSRLGGVHLELTGDVDERGYSVTECVGGSMQLKDEDLARNYQVGQVGWRRMRERMHSRFFSRLFH